MFLLMASRLFFLFLFFSLVPTELIQLQIDFLPAAGGAKDLSVCLSSRLSPHFGLVPDPVMLVFVIQLAKNLRLFLYKDIYNISFQT